MDTPSGRGVRARGAREPLSPGVSSLVRALSGSVFLQWVGAGSLLPLLPLYVRHHGGSDAVVGAVMAAYFAAAFVFQYGAGRISDRFGRVPVMVAGLVAYAAGSLLFLVPGRPVFDVVFRMLQGAGAGAALVSALAMISHAVPMSHRGRAAGRVYGAELGGLAVGPVLGSLAGVAAMPWLFVASAVASLAAIVPVLAVRGSASLETPPGAWSGSPGEGALAHGTPPPPVAARPAARPATGRSVARLVLWGALLAAAAIGATSGVYEACWTLLMTNHGAVEWEIGVSWTLFALPFALASRPAGWLADHFDRRWLAVAALLWSAAFCAVYPFLPGFVLLLVLSVWESLGLALALPACQSLLGDATPPERHGHVQGLFAASQTGATALAAAGAGALFAIDPWVPFVSAAVCCTVLVVLVAVSWRHAPGRVRAGTTALAALDDRRE